MPKIEVFADKNGLMQAAAEEFVNLAVSAIQVRGQFTIALSGGSTPGALYSLLATDAYRERVEWAKVHFFWGDERCVPPGDVQSNYHTAYEALLSKVPVPTSNIHRMHGEDEPDKAATDYEQLLQRWFGDNQTSASSFDLVWLGMGDNGHTASLFPGLAVVTEQTRWVMAQYVEVVTMWRVTLTPVIINAARHITFLVAGADKARRLQEVLEGKPQPIVLPAQIIQPTNGQLTWLLDKAAAANLKNR